MEREGVMQFARDFILDAARKTIRGEALTPHEQKYVGVLVRWPGYKPPVQITCSACPYNVLVLMSEHDELTPSNLTAFKRETNGRWRCVWCGSHAIGVQTVRVH